MFTSVKTSKLVYLDILCLITAQIESVGQLLANAETTMFRNEEAKWRIVGLARDLRGIIFAFNTRHTYMMFFDWM